ncbi:MAG: hypothetical protein K8S87_08810 [Planctomycetes bacterium]|nr:hypothetical protein [Planctomycetota bacterium]
MRQIFITLMLLFLIIQGVNCTFDDTIPEIINLIVPENVFAGQVVPIYFEIENTSLRSIEIRRVEFNFRRQRVRLATSTANMRRRL